jgi:hypothetical protein
MIKYIIIFCVFTISCFYKSLNFTKTVDLEEEITLEGTLDSMTTQTYENMGYHLFFFTFKKYGTKRVRYFIPTFEDGLIDYGIWSNCQLYKGQRYKFRVKKTTNSIPIKTVYSFVEKKYNLRLSSSLFEEKINTVLANEKLSNEIKVSMNFPEKLYFDMDNNIFLIENVSPCSSKMNRKKVHRGF